VFPLLPGQARSVRCRQGPPGPADGRSGGFV